MLLNIIGRSFLNQKKSMALMTASIAVGTALVASLITVSLDVAAKVSKELRSFGANILVEPKVEGLADISGHKRYLRSEDIAKLKAIFWRHNIVGIAPFLKSDAVLSAGGKEGGVTLAGAWYEKEIPLPGEAGNFTAGIKTVYSWWEIKGRWPQGKDEIIAGVSAATQYSISPGDSILLDGRRVTVSGTLETGGPEDGWMFMDLAPLQEIKGLDGKVSRVLVSALTTPMDDFAYKDPESMSISEYEKWYCTGYVTSIAKQAEEVFEGSSARPIWQVAATEGKVLEKISLLIYLLCASALAASAIGVSTTMIMSLLRRVEEIALMKALGADRWRIITLFLAEGILIGIAGGLFGYLFSIGVSEYIGLKVFDSGLQQRAVLLPIAIGSAIVISAAGTVLPIRRALSIRPGIILKGAR